MSVLLWSLEFSRMRGVSWLGSNDDYRQVRMTMYRYYLSRSSTYRGGRITALNIEEAALFRKTDWESGRGLLPCWKAESAPLATTIPSHNRLRVVQKSLTEKSNRISSQADWEKTKDTGAKVHSTAVLGPVHYPVYYPVYYWSICT